MHFFWSNVIKYCDLFFLQYLVVIVILLVIGQCYCWRMILKIYLLYFIVVNHFFFFFIKLFVVILILPFFLGRHWNNKKKIQSLRSAFMSVDVLRIVPVLFVLCLFLLKYFNQSLISFLLLLPLSLFSLRDCVRSLFFLFEARPLPSTPRWQKFCTMQKIFPKINAYASSVNFLHVLLNSVLLNTFFFNVQIIFNSSEVIGFSHVYKGPAEVWRKIEEKEFVRLKLVFTFKLRYKSFYLAS